MRKNVAGQTVRFSLFKSGARIAAPTIAVGDFKVDLDGAGQNNVNTLPTSDSAGLVTWSPTQAETNANVVTLLGVDVAGDQWEPLTIVFYTLADTTIATNLDATVSSRAQESTLTAIKGTGWTDETLVAIGASLDAIADDTAEIGVAGAGLTALGDARLANLDATVSSRALEATLTAIKGIGWTDETLVAIDVLLNAIKTRTDLLGTGSVTVSAPVPASGEPTIYQSDDYAAVDSRALEWTNAAGTWPDLTSATITLYVRAPDGSKSNYAGSVVTPTGAGQKVRVELTSAQTGALLAHSRLEIQLRAALAGAGRKVTLVYGTLTTREFLG